VSFASGLSEINHENSAVDRKLVWNVPPRFIGLSLTIYDAS
jgi:hypothetical protein